MTNHVISTMYYFMCVMLTSDVNCLFTPRSEENNGKKNRDNWPASFSCWHAQYVTKMSPYLVTDPTFRLYELSGLIQELSKSNNPLSNLFCGEGWTKRSFLGLGSPTIKYNYSDFRGGASHGTLVPLHLPLLGFCFFFFLFCFCFCFFCFCVCCIINLHCLSLEEHPIKLWKQYFSYRWPASCNYDH